MNGKWMWLMIRIWAMQLVVLLAVMTGSKRIKIWALRKLMKFIPELLSHIPEPHMEA
ncbi:MAG: hypothetical protein ACRCTP_03880 [Aeromonas popoffii]|uniref:hypothetical protein n=1 Tax=Aeromonas popoffii TaxID=70856 RepID=UPI003F2AD7B3